MKDETSEECSLSQSSSSYPPFSQQTQSQSQNSSLPPLPPPPPPLSRPPPPSSRDRPSLPSIHPQPPPPPPANLGVGEGGGAIRGESAMLTKKKVAVIVRPSTLTKLMAHFDISQLCSAQERVDRLFWCLKEVPGVNSSDDIERFASSLTFPLPTPPRKPPPSTAVDLLLPPAPVVAARPVLGGFVPSVNANAQELYRWQQRLLSSSSSVVPTSAAPRDPSQASQFSPESFIMHWVEISELPSSLVAATSAPPWVSCARNASNFSDDDAVVLLHPLLKPSLSTAGTTKNIADLCLNSARALVSPPSLTPASPFPSSTYRSNGFALPSSASSRPFSSTYPVLLLRRDAACRQSFGLQLASASRASLFDNALYQRDELPLSPQYIVVTAVEAFSPAESASDILHTLFPPRALSSSGSLWNNTEPLPPRGLLVGDVILCVRGRSVLGGPNSLPLSAADVEVELELAGRECVLVVAARESDQDDVVRALEGTIKNLSSSTAATKKRIGSASKLAQDDASEDDDDPIILPIKKKQSAGPTPAAPPATVERSAGALAWAIARQRRIREESNVASDPKGARRHANSKEDAKETSNTLRKGATKTTGITVSASALLNKDPPLKNVASTKSSGRQGSFPPRRRRTEVDDESSDDRSEDGDNEMHDDQHHDNTGRGNKRGEKKLATKVKRNTCADLCEGMIVQVHTGNAANDDDEYGVVVEIQKARRGRKGGDWVVVEREEGADLIVRPWQLQVAGEDYRSDDTADNDHDVVLGGDGDENTTSNSIASRRKTAVQQQGAKKGETFQSRGRLRPSANDICSAFEAENVETATAAKSTAAANDSKKSSAASSKVVGKKKGGTQSIENSAVTIKNHRGCFTVEFSKGTIGLNLEAASSSTGLGSQVRALYPNTPAELCGQIERGDKILRVNKRDVMAATHASIVSLIKAEAAIGPVTIEFSRTRTNSVEAIKKNAESSSDGFTTPVKSKLPSSSSFLAADEDAEDLEEKNKKKKKKKKVLSVSPTPHPKFEVAQRVKVNFHDSWYAAFITNRWVVRGAVGEVGGAEGGGDHDHKSFVYSIRYEKNTNRLQGATIGVVLDDNISEDRIVDATTVGGAKRSSKNRGGDTSSQGSVSSCSDANEWRPCVCGNNHHSGEKDKSKFFHADTSDNVGGIFWLQCDDCNDWFEVGETCVGFSEEFASNMPDPWRCPACTRERRRTVRVFQGLPAKRKHSEGEDETTREKEEQAADERRADSRDEGERVGGVNAELVEGEKNYAETEDDEEGGAKRGQHQSSRSGGTPLDMELEREEEEKIEGEGEDMIGGATGEKATIAEEAMEEDEEEATGASNKSDESESSFQTQSQDDDFGGDSFLATWGGGGGGEDYLENDYDEEDDDITQA